ncbi:6-phosphofructo-2-kinase 1 [Monosporozyma servazzii]
MASNRKDEPKHVRMVQVEPSNTDYKVNKPLPAFQRRPLSDTPVVTTLNTPTRSHESTPSTSRETTPIFVNQGSGLRSSEDYEFDDEEEEVNKGTSFTTSDTDEASSSKYKYKRVTRFPNTLDVPGLTRSKTSPDGIISKEEAASKLVIVMVGLPATGKSFITNKLSRYLNYSMYYCKVFNVGNTRRRYAKEHGIGDQDSNFFDPRNNQANQLRDKWAMDTLDELLDYLLEGDGSVAIFDATNSTRARRKMLVDKIQSRNDQLNILFLESICTDDTVVESNIRLKLFGPDYKGKDPENSLVDFKQRLQNYLDAYETVEDEEEVQYIKMIDIGKKVVSYNIEGFLASQAVYYLLNFNLSYRQIWITRNGESVSNMQGRIGGDSPLTVRGEKYSKALYKFIDKQRQLLYEAELKQFEEAKRNQNPSSTVSSNKKLKGRHIFKNFFVWTSMRKRAIQTGKYFDGNDYPSKEMKMLDEINAGLFEGLTYQEFENNFPVDFERRQHDKLKYRFPGIGGESYLDVINRLRTVITEMERIEDNVLIITHRVVARALLGYFMNLGFQNITELDVPLHCVYCLEPMPYGIRWSLYEYDEATDDFHKVPQSELNVTRVKQIGLVHREKHFSLVPTAPSSRASSMASVHSTSSKRSGGLDDEVTGQSSYLPNDSSATGPGNNNPWNLLRSISILESGNERASTRLPVKPFNLPVTSSSLLQHEANVALTHDPLNTYTTNTSVPSMGCRSPSPVSIISSTDSASLTTRGSGLLDNNVASRETFQNLEHLQDEFDQLKLSNSQVYERLHKND